MENWHGEQSEPLSALQLPSVGRQKRFSSTCTRTHSDSVNTLSIENHQLVGLQCHSGSFVVSFFLQKGPTPWTVVLVDPPKPRCNGWMDGCGVCVCTRVTGSMWPYHLSFQNNLRPTETRSLDLKLIPILHDLDHHSPTLLFSYFRLPT